MGNEAVSVVGVVPCTERADAAMRIAASLTNDDQAQEGRLADALALRGEEGRDRLRKAPGSCQYTLIRRSPNGATPSIRMIAD